MTLGFCDYLFGSNALALGGKPAGSRSDSHASKAEKRIIGEVVGRKKETTVNVVR